MELTQVWFYRPMIRILEPGWDCVNRIWLARFDKTSRMREIKRDLTDLPFFCCKGVKRAVEPRIKINYE
jgi:hypothetical protein